MNHLLNIPMAPRLAVLLVAGAAVASLLNLAIYRLAWHPRRISPWSPPPAKAPPRHWTDRIPIYGWLGLRRESKLHGGGHWLRPMMLEILTGAGFAALYWWEIGRAGLLPPLPPGTQLSVEVQAILHAALWSHLLLICLMIVASMIDVDEKIIPDAVTVPGTILGLLLAAACPASLLPVVQKTLMGPPPAHAVPLPLPRGAVFEIDFLNAVSPLAWPDVLGGAPQYRSLLIALGCFLMWCFALLPRPWRTRHGVGRALRILTARIRRERVSRWILAMAVIGSAAIAVVWWQGGVRWMALVTSLMGLAGSGGLIWLVRIIGTAALRREAMGFGDVTLMAMIGTFLGWQPCLMIFFMAPFAGLAIGLAQWMFHRRTEIPYGPFLCLASVVMIVCWASLWNWARGEPGGLQPGVFAIPWLVPAAVGVCLILMAGMLTFLHALRRT